MLWRYFLFEIKQQCTSLKTIVLTLSLFLLFLGFMLYSAYMHRAAPDYRATALRAAEVEASNIIQMIRLEQLHYGMDFRMYRPQAELDALFTMVNEDVRRIAAQRINLTYEREGLDPAWERFLTASVLRHERLLVNFYAWREARAEGLGVPVTYIDFDDPTMYYPYRLRYTEASLIRTILFYRYLQNNAIPVIYSPYDPSAFRLMYRINMTLGLFVLPLLVVFLSADIFSKESERGGYKVLLMQPLSRAGVYVAKLASSFVICLAVLALPLGMIFGVAAVIFGLGDGNYLVPFNPTDVQRATAYETAAQVLARLDLYTAIPEGFITVAEYLLWIIPVVALYIFFMVGFTVFVSMLVRDNVFALAASLGIVLPGLMLAEFIWERALWNPIAYADINYIIINGYTGFLWYLVLWAVAFIIVGMGWFRRKDIIC
ncbi:MAG: ABC transporter permease [Defluviitaleaceae bacterium]|nr:ABC transporter permease [Defluviitaleaceae bacterium]MCL2239877.1 ABC transporter permease [Defluviitaleaceae bacterium]